MNRNLLFPTLLAGAIGLPFMILNDGRSGTQSSPTASWFGEVNANDPNFKSSGSLAFSGDNTAANNLAGPSQIVSPTDLRDVFRLDVTPQWVSQNWDRISSIEGSDGLRALRVAFVSGTNQSDLHGCLTYGFDSRARLQRISFQGWTGDPNQIISLVTQNFGLESRKSTIAGCYVARSWGKDIGVLLLKHPPVVRAEMPQQRMAVALEILNPSSNYQLGNETRQFLDDAIGR